MNNSINLLFVIVLSTFLITLCVLMAVIFVLMKKELLSKITIFLVSLSAGALMGGAFLHLLPEALEKINSQQAFSIFLVAFVTFFFIERVLHWRHCHKAECAVHTFGYMNLIGDSVHNFIDGLIIASTFMFDFHLGVVTTLAIAVHEIPQEIGDFGVLIHAGYTNKKALMLNYVVALMVVLGGIVGFFSFYYLENILPYLLPFAAGGFVYIAASDLMPEIRKETKLKRSMGTFFVFILGILMMYAVRFLGS